MIARSYKIVVAAQVGCEAEPTLKFDHNINDQQKMKMAEDRTECPSLEKGMMNSPRHLLKVEDSHPEQSMLYL
jgi:hypothetical protein